MSAFDELTESFSRLPGIGKKSAVRIVNHILKQDAAEAMRFAQRLSVLHEKIKPCSVISSVDVQITSSVPFGYFFGSSYISMQ